MIESAHPGPKTLPPHIRSRDSLSRRYWGQALALIPVFAAGCFTGHAEILRVLLTCLVSAIAFDFLANKFFQKKEKLQNGEIVLAAAIFSLLIPSRCPSEAIILGIFMAVFLARGLLGGTGSYPLHPLLLAYVFLQLCFPQINSAPMLFAGEGSLWTLGALVLGGVIFLKQKQGYGETPVLFMSICFLCEALWGSGEAPQAFFSGVLLTSFFLLGDPATLPLTRKGTALFALGAALLSSGLTPEGFSIRSAGFAILTMNLLTPWLDVWLKPVSYKTKDPIKATYPS